MRRNLLRLTTMTATILKLTTARKKSLRKLNIWTQMSTLEPNRLNTTLLPVGTPRDINEPATSRGRNSNEQVKVIKTFVYKFVY